MKETLQEPSKFTALLGWVLVSVSVQTLYFVRELKCGLVLGFPVPTDGVAACATIWKPIPLPALNMLVPSAPAIATPHLLHACVVQYTDVDTYCQEGNGSPAFAKNRNLRENSSKMRG